MAYLPEKDPIKLFSEWYKEVMHSMCKEPTAMILATCDKDCNPSARVVLLKEYSAEGFIFFTNASSRKGDELMQNPKASLVFYWGEFAKQVRVEGAVKLLDHAKSDEYFSSRTVDSQISALCSKQSSILESWHSFELDMELKRAQYHNQQVPRPDFWVGFLVVPKTIEFWKEGVHRKHTRYRYTMVDQGSWRIEQLYP